MKFRPLCPPVAAAIAVALSLASPVPAGAQEAADVSAGTSAYRDSIAQDELRADTEQVRQELGLLLEELRQSPAAMAERSEVQSAVEKLGALSDRNMAAVVLALRNAGSQGNADAVQSKLLTASQGQKDIQLLLKTLSDRLARQRTQAALQARLQALVLRQTVNLREVNVVADPQTHQSNNQAKQSAASLGAEEGAIQQELAQALIAMRQTVAGGSAGGDARAVAAALKEATDRQIANQAGAAAAATLAGKFPEAASPQQAALDGMQAMLLRLSEAQSLPERLQQLAAQARDLSAEQKQLAETSRAEVPRATENAARQDLRERQQRLTDRAAALHAQVAALNADAAGDLREAATAMDGATSILAQHWDALRNSATPQKSKNGAPLPLNFHATFVKAQDEAAGKLDDLGAKLDHQAETLANAAPPPPADPAQTLASLEQLGKQVDQTLDQEMALAANPADPAAASEQQKLADTTTGLQKTAQPVSPEAAAELGQAAEHLHQAVEDLTQASATIKRQVQTLADAITAEEPVNQLITQLATVKAQTVQADETMQRGPAGSLTDAAQQTERAERSLQDVQTAATQAGALVPPEAKQNLEEAARLLAQSRLLATQNERARAMAANGEAQSALDRAAKTLQEAKDAALGQAMPQGGPMLAQGNQKAAPDATRGSPDDKASTSLLAAQTGDGGPAQIASGLKPKDRDAILLLEKETTPAEYSSMVGQYTKNLSDADSPEIDLP